MTARIEQLSSQLVVPGLEALRSVAAVGGYALLAQARMLAETWRLAPGVELTRGAADNDEDGIALRLDHGDGLVEIDCMLDDPETQLVAQWQALVPIHLSVRVGDALWIEHAGAHGMLVHDSAGLLQAPADRTRFTRLPERAQAELERWRRQHPDTQWTCPQCAFRNAAPERTCGICGGTAAGGAPLNEVLRQRSSPALGHIESLRAGIELPLPEGLADLIGELGGLAALLATQAPAAAVDVWLLGYDHARKSSLMRALIDARAAAGLTRNELSDVLQLAATLPACVGRGLSSADAGRMHSHLVGAGARVEIRQHDAGHQR